VLVIPNDDEVSFDEDKPLQRRLRSSSTIHRSHGPISTTFDVTTVAKGMADWEAADKRVTEEAVVRRQRTSRSLTREPQRRPW
jgi:hypothetical protein